MGACHARMVKRLAAVSLVLALGGWDPFRSIDSDVAAGNKAIEEHRWDDALTAYDRAAHGGGVDGDGLAYDRAAAELGKAKSAADPNERAKLSDRAFDDLVQAEKSKDPHLRGEAAFNRGNALMDRDKVDEAIDAYKHALRDDPAIDGARENLELALRKRHQNEKQQQQGQGQGQPQQGQGQQQQPQQGQGQGQGQQQQPQQGQGQGQGQQQQPQQGSGQQPNQQNQQGSGQSQNQQNQQGQQGQQGQQDPKQGPDGQSAQGSPNNSKGKPHRHGTQGQSPKTPTDRKLDDLEEGSDPLQRANASRHATTRHDPGSLRDW